MKVYIDISKLIMVDFITGIQRVVREIVVRMVKSDKFDVVLLNYNRKIREFEIISNDKFLAHFEHNQGEVKDIVTSETCSIDEIPCNSIFFDIDSVWVSKFKRSYILPILKKNGVKIAVQIYDIIPITHPQYCHQNTTYFFMNYLAAHLEYADIIIVSTESTKQEINMLTDQLSLGRKKIEVVPLGSDFIDDVTKKGDVDKTVIKIAARQKYILMVGTIEPRKNHKLLIDAYDKYLSNENINIIIAGRVGWNVEEFVKQLMGHYDYNSRIFHVEGANDATIDYLYRNAFYVAFPTYNEGFGLPLIEAIERGTPVAATNIGVLREVGKDFCQYFEQDNAKELADIIKACLQDQTAYTKIKEKLANFVGIKWDESAEMMISVLQDFLLESQLEIGSIKQMVVLSARHNDLLQTLPFVENMMPFIKELVLCCPDKMVDIFTTEYKGKLSVKFLTDSELLKDVELPADHTHRNYLLRCLAMQNDLIEDTFLMSDDDYRPLINITEDTFIKDNKYIGYYCYHIDKWNGTGYRKASTSYDFSMYRTADFLIENTYPTLQYSSHMPQVINKTIYKEMLKKHKGIEFEGLDEWSTYFNYAVAHYSGYFINKPYVSMCWPGAPTDWELDVIPKEYLFENFYEGLYEPKGIFEGFSKEYHDAIVDENVRKIARVFSKRKEHEVSKVTFNTYKSMYNIINNQYPELSILVSKDKLMIYLPKYIVFYRNGCNKVRLEINYLDENIVDMFPLTLQYSFMSNSNQQMTNPSGIAVLHNEKVVYLPVISMGCLGSYTIQFSCRTNDSANVFLQTTKVIFI